MFVFLFWNKELTHPLGKYKFFSQRIELDSAKWLHGLDFFLQPQVYTLACGGLCRIEERRREEVPVCPGSGAFTHNPVDSCLQQNMTHPLTVVDLIRHGEPEGGVRIRGWQDDPLSDRGWRQMWQAVDGDNPWSLVVSSPLSRCAGFAGQLASRNGIPLQHEERLKEIGFGEWEGLTPDSLCASDPESISRFWNDPTANPPPGGEPFQQFQRRVTQAWRDIEESNRGGHLLLVAHGGVIRMLIAHVLGMPATNLFRMEVPYAARSRICVEQDGVARLSFHCANI